MNDAKHEPKAPKKYADSSISDKVFKRAILWFFIYCTLFMLGVIWTIGLDHAAIQ